MPLYEYNCKTCGYDTMLLQSVGAYLVTVPACPDFHGPMEHVVSANTFHLKGSGWAMDKYQKD